MQHGQRSKLLTDGRADKGRAAAGPSASHTLTLQSLPSNLHTLSAGQLASVCAAHGFHPKSKTQGGIIKVRAWWGLGIGRGGVRDRELWLVGKGRVTGRDAGTAS